MNSIYKILTTSVFVLGGTLLSRPETALAQLQTINNTALPSVIRVAIRAYNNPVAPIEYVQTIGFQEYCRDVLPNEWIPSWNVEALRAGAIAIKMFAWYHTLHPVTEEGFTFDVDNTTNFQQFKYLSGSVATDQAVFDTWNIVYVPPTSEIKELQYRSGVPNRENSAYIGSNIMSQWGSEYWGRVARLTFPNILIMYYPDYTLKFI